MSNSSEQIVLKLYITGYTARSKVAIRNLKELCSKEYGSNYRLDIIDVLEQPEQAEHDKILATPSLLKILPPPIRRIIGDLSDREKVIHSLDIAVNPNEK